MGKDANKTAILGVFNFVGIGYLEYISTESFAPGAQVVHIKMQIIGTVEQVIDDMVYVKIAENKPLQAWKRDELAIWDQRGEIQKRLKRGGYIRDIYKKED